MKRIIILLIAMALTGVSKAQSHENYGLSAKEKDFRLDFSLGQSYMSAENNQSEGVFNASALLNYGYYQNERLFFALGIGVQFFDLPLERAFSFPVYGSARYYVVKKRAFVDVKLGYSIGTEQSNDLINNNEQMPYGKITRKVSGVYFEGWLGGTFGQYDIGIGYNNNTVQYHELRLNSFETKDYSRDLHTVFLRISRHF